MRPQARYSQFITLLTVVALWSVLLSVEARAAESGEYQVKAAMVFNMLRFIDWPDDALLPTSAQLTVCIVGKGPLGAAIEPLQGKQIKGRSFAVRTDGALAGCQVVVVTTTDRNSVASLLQKTASQPVVTVADSSGFARSGGMVGLVLQQGKVRFEINTTVASKHRIRISSQLLKLAQVVQETP